VTRYAVGDLQGSLQPLQCLLQRVDFSPAQDQLWLVGDLINRGNDSLGSLRFVKQLGDSARVVLGNHDLHFLAIALGTRELGRHDTFGDILAADDRESLVAWLLSQPLMYSDPSGDYHMSHAGIPPQWSIEQASGYATEVQRVLRGDNPAAFFEQMYGDSPDLWQEELCGYPRLRLITNYFTRMRFCTAAGKLDLHYKQLSHPDAEYAPWFCHRRRSEHDNIIFGHWAALEGQADAEHVYALDTGCAWGGWLTLFNLDSGERHRCDCPNSEEEH